MPKFMNHVDLQKNELRSAVVEKLASAPGSPVEGQIYYDTGAGAVYVRDASSFKKQVLSGQIVNADINASAAIAYSKLSLANSIVNADIASGAAIAYSKLNLSASIVNADIAAGAAIALSKLAVDPLARANHTGTQTASTISDFDTQVRTSRLDQMAAPTASVSMNSQRITNVADPSGAQDAATKAYVDLLTAAGLRTFKDAVRLATAAALPANTRSSNTLTADANGALTVDDVAVAAGNRILVKDEATGANNGIYTVTQAGSAGTPFILDRATDADTSVEVKAGMYMIVDEGTANADSAWVLATNDPITLNTTSLTFTKHTQLADLVAGAGLTKTGNTLDVGGTTNRITVNADSIDISASYVGQTSITTLGTITTGVWNGTTIAVANGGTGATTAAGAKTNLGFMTRSAGLIGDGSATSIAYTHSLGTRDVVVEVYNATTYEKVYPDITHTDTNTVTLDFAVAPTSNQFRVVVVG